MQNADSGAITGWLQMTPSHSQINSDLLRPLLRTSWKFYAVVTILGGIVVTALVSWLSPSGGSAPGVE